MNTDNMYDVLPGEEDFQEEKDASPEETPPQPTRQGDLSLFSNFMIIMTIDALGHDQACPSSD